MNFRSPPLVALAATTALLLAAGCSDEEGATTSSTTEASENAAAGSAEPVSTDDADAYCEAVLAIETAGEPDIDYETATEEEIAQAAQTFARETMVPLVDEALRVAPQEIRDDAETVEAALTALADEGDMAAFDSPEVVAANARIHEYDLSACGWEAVEMSTHEYGFDGLPQGLAAGPTSFELENHGEEVHEMVLIQRGEGVDQPVEELLEMPDEQVMELITVLGTAGPVPGGESSYLVADLEPGGYIAICFIPTGTTALDGPPPEGIPHFVNGMVAEFQVT